jgi:head-tail adaptor
VNWFLEHLDDFIPYVEIAGLVAAIVALLFAIKQARDAALHTETLRKQMDHLQAHTDQLKIHTDALQTISDSLSTRYQRRFPDFLDVIVTDVIKKAEGHLRITCDFGSYGYFSHHEFYIRYKQEIEAAINRNVQVEILTLDDKQALELARRQFGTDVEDRSTWKQPVMRKLEDFVRRYNRRKHQSPSAEQIRQEAEQISLGEFIDRVLEINKLHNSEEFREAKCCRVPHPLALYS